MSSKSCQNYDPILKIVANHENHENPSKITKKKPSGKANNTDRTSNTINNIIQHCEQLIQCFLE